MAKPPTSHADLLNRIDNDWADLQAALANLSDDQLIIPDEGGWSIKDNLAHLTAWEHALVHRHFQNKPAEEVWGLDAKTLKSQSAINAAIWERTQSQTVAQALSASQQAHAEVLEALQALTFDDLLKPRFADKPEQGPLLNWVIGDTYEHYQEHGANILKLAEKLKS